MILPYDDNADLMTKPVKRPTPGWKSLRTTCLVDVMANVRKLSIKDLRAFAYLCATFLNMKLSISQNANRMYLVFDPYNTRTQKEEKDLQQHLLGLVWWLPINMDTLWSSVSDKAKLQSYEKIWNGKCGECVPRS